MCETKPTNSRWFLYLFSKMELLSLRKKNPINFSSFFPPSTIIFDELTPGKYQVLFFIDNNHLLVYSIAESEFLILKECDKTTDKIQELYKNKFVYDKSNIMILTKRKSSYYNLRDPIWQNIPVQNIVNFSPKIL